MNKFLNKPPYNIILQFYVVTAQHAVQVFYSASRGGAKGTATMAMAIALLGSVMATNGFGHNIFAVIIGLRVVYTKRNAYLECLCHSRKHYRC